LYDFTNIEIDEIELFTVEVDGQRSPKVFLTPALVTPDEREFCPAGDQLTIPNPIPGSNVCSLSVRGVVFDVELNDLVASGSSILFPPPLLHCCLCVRMENEYPTTLMEMTFVVNDECR
jgi:hypothetical protein